ncbi:reticulon-1-A-like isoform X2 [Lingula anatina]|uniref:Reticulon-like protein n=1 Tax=Lingula anatina TaxID=7574 RepID=A0A1S3JIB4_LINAN|nr:reticulon-1-A isoform X3 [Lingula anatina]XP_013409882.1 reticulon-1-A isoform X4 [Lingula anatina]XP_013409888.1 reticulon-1-A-like isoform X2 [Lingula anatina]|eukprot:XP_013409881.1 reticulon-1-A isoform X3 [Lingula anatina]
MDPFESPIQSNGQNEDNNFGDFEKVEPVSTTTTEEEDMYSAAKQPEQEAATGDLLGSFSESSSEKTEPIAPPTYEPEPEITSTREPTPPPRKELRGGKEPSSFPGGFGKNLKIDPRVLDLIYWRDVKKTGVVFGSVLVILLSLTSFSVISVLAYVSLAALTVTFSFRVYKNVLQAVQKSNEGHPFKVWLEKDISLPEDKMQQAARALAQHLNEDAVRLRRLFLVEDLVDSVKFGLLLWVMTYIGAWFNVMTLVILAVVAVFTLPKVYETYQVQIDEVLDKAKTQIMNVVEQVKAKLPFLNKKDKQKTQ